MIVKMSRGSIVLERDGKHVTLEGEFTFPDDQHYVFHMFGRRPTHWDGANAGVLSNADFESFVDELRREFAKSGGRVEPS